MDQKQIGVLIAIAVAVLSLTGVAALAGVGPFGDNPENKNVYDAVPQQAQYVFYADVNGFLNDPTTKKVGNHVLMNYSEQNMTYEEALSKFEMQTNKQLNSTFREQNLSVDFQVEDVGQVVVYGKYNATSQQVGSSMPSVSQNYTAAVFELNITKQEFNELSTAIVNRTQNGESSANAQMTTYNGHKIVTITEDNQSVSLALLEQGTHVAGTTNAVKDAIDTWEGDNNAVDPALIPNGTGQNTYFGFGLEANKELQDRVQKQLNSSPKVEAFTGTYSTDGNNEIFLDLTVTVDTASSADDLAMELRQNINKTSNQTNTGQLKNIEVGVQNTDVTIRYNTTTDQINNTIDKFATQFPIGQTPDDNPEPPQEFPEATLAYEYNSTSDQLTVTVQDAGNVNSLIVYDDAGNTYSLAAEDGATTTIPAQGGDYIRVTGKTSESAESYTVSTYFVPQATTTALIAP